MSNPFFLHALAAAGTLIYAWLCWRRSSPAATITGFIWLQEAVDYAKTNRVALAILDIELGTASGLDLSRTLLKINPRMNIVFLTAYPDYSLEAWETEASGFIVKPLTAEHVKAQLKKLGYPFSMGGGSV